MRAKEMAAEVSTNLIYVGIGGISEWCKRHCKGQYKLNKTNPFNWEFELVSDATEFQEHWGGIITYFD